MPKAKIHDIIIVGGGITSHTAALYTARADMHPLVISAPDLDQLSLTTTVENFPGFPEGVQGPDLSDNSKKQAKRFGAEYKTAWVTSFKKSGSNYEIGTDKEKFIARTVIIATGASARWTGVKGEETYKGKGVSTCAVCDAALYRGKETIVIGGGDSAMEEALALMKFAKNVTIVHRRDEFRASKIMQDRVLKEKKIKVIWNAQISEVLGDGKFVTGAKLKDTKTRKEKEVKCDGIFLAIGHIPNTKVFKGVKLDKLGYIITDKNVNTNLKGVYAAGDVQDPRYKQAITSAGSGCKAAIESERYVEDLKNHKKY